MGNIFYRLMDIEKIPEYPNAILVINIKNEYAKLLTEFSSPQELVLNDYSVGENYSKSIIGDIAERIGLDIDGDICLLNIFIDIRCDILKEIEKKKKQNEELYLYRQKCKQPIENINYFDSFIGRKYLCDCSDELLKQVFEDFKKVKHDKLKELHKILSVRKLEVLRESDIQYWAAMGFDYISNNSRYINTKDPKYILSPLVDINDDYAKSKVHIINIELAYLNRNIKAIKREFRRRKENGNE